MQDPLTEAKLQFFITQAKLLTPYLEKYQTEKPMLVFMSDDLETILKTIMKKYMKKDLVQEASSYKLTQLDFKKDVNLVPTKNVDIGFAVKQQLDKKKNISQLQLLEFKTECKTFLQGITEKLIERSPLKYSLVRNLSCLSPKLIAEDPEKAKTRFEKVLDKMLECRRLNADECDTTKQQFDGLVTEIQVQI